MQPGAAQRNDSPSRRSTPQQTASYVWSSAEVTGCACVCWMSCGAALWLGAGAEFSRSSALIHNSCVSVHQTMARRRGFSLTTLKCCSPCFHSVSCCFFLFFPFVSAFSCLDVTTCQARGASRCPRFNVYWLFFEKSLLNNSRKAEPPGNLMTSWI